MTGHRGPTRTRTPGSVLRMLGSVGASALLVTALVAVPAGAAPSTSAKAPLASDTGRSTDLTAAMAQAYRNTYPGLSADAAARAATVQSSGEQLKAELVKRADTFGGAWFDPFSATYQVAVTTATAEAEIATISRDLRVPVRTHRVTRTYAQLEQLAESLRTGTDAFSRAAAGLVGIDVETNQVVVAIPSRQRAALAGAVPAGVSLVDAQNRPFDLDVCNSRNDCNDSLRSGLVIRRSGGSCSAGFTARGSTGIRFLLTSGHCAGLNAAWSTGTTTPTTIGTMTDAIDSGVVDAGAIQVTNASYSADTVGRIYMHNMAGRFVGVNGAAPSMSFILQGETVCLAARIIDPANPGNPCGTITSVSDPNKRGMVRVGGYDACPGDSGGGWYWLSSSGSRWAYGLHSRSESGCNAAPNNSWFSPLPSFWTGLTYELG
ncbi:hypothetical protein O7632_23050 [Solwaraspora sp. WMMD406]|uniref:hypothetical protein n=1 Tax=Solwaraspora sp. WMMD406 TaxID=3016095 RepID=UPI002416E3D4|nr:hypothetical protein [Solwaraspora sp. WMMD406]MDG4766952.1 hypothetical protein [Solwaraspora sp. WMMD406]